MLDARFSTAGCILRPADHLTWPSAANPGSGG
jgi:hypothetical protein